MTTAFDNASRGIGTGIGIAAMGIGLGIAFDAMKDFKTRHRKTKQQSFDFPTIKPLKHNKRFKW